jgi:hypothetical protein
MFKRLFGESIRSYYLMTKRVAYFNPAGNTQNAEIKKTCLTFDKLFLLALQYVPNITIGLLVR